MSNLNIFLNTLSIIINISLEILFIAANLAFLFLLHLVNFYVFACETRAVINWFPNINPYLAPWDKLSNLTRPINDFGSTIYPRIFNLNVTFYINSFILQQFLSFLEYINYYRVQLDYYKPNIIIKLPEINSMIKKKKSKSIFYRIKKFFVKKMMKLILRYM